MNSMRNSKEFINSEYTSVTNGYKSATRQNERNQYYRCMTLRKNQSLTSKSFVVQSVQPNNSEATLLPHTNYGRRIPLLLPEKEMSRRSLITQGINKQL
ncbi:hypothetical protein V5799_014472 [Amblyomma americanum]|uniref:Uncharacterized protein n=1 Tax=Amblyomma americanum TaxID=6943 RepID=A0AAQ4E2X8_AMBAM